MLNTMRLVASSLRSKKNMSKRNPVKAKLAAEHPERPGEECKAEAGAWMPVINQTRCEAKNDCVEVCPYDVFEVRQIEPQDYQALTFMQRIKVRVHGMKMAYTPNADACRACGLCVVACPEQAITLVRS
jgi:NAD-dependent dihydropyrimidine dehydrogenase PreA subunit